MMERTFTAMLLSLALTGCFVFDDEHLRSLQDGGGGQGDGGPGTDAKVTEDAGGLVLEDQCGTSPRTVLTQTTRNIAIDTRTLGNHVTSSCGGAPTLGNDAFLAIDVQASVYWHFHLRGDPADPGSTSRAPALYMLFAPTGSCDARDCRFGSDVCDEEGDEHFGFVADSAGRWYLGIDDREAGGGQYLLDAIRPTCGDNVRDHGEACDDGELLNGDGCSSRCLRELTTELPREIEPNDNPTEANFLAMGAATEFIVEGAIGGEGTCRYSDVFAVDVPRNARVEIDVLNPDGTVCADGALTAQYELEVRNAAFTNVVDGMVDSAMCAIARTPVLTGGGLYYVVVRLPQDTALPIPYRLRVRLVA